VCVYNWVEQRCQLLWTCHVYVKVSQLLVLFLSRTSCFRSIPNVFYMKVFPLSTFTPVCYLSFGTLTYVTEQTHQILEMYFCMNDRKWDVSDETRLWWTFFFLALLAYCCDPGRECSSVQHTAFIFALWNGDTSWIFDPLNQHSSKSFHFYTVQENKIQSQTTNYLH